MQQMAAQSCLAITTVNDGLRRITLLYDSLRRLTTVYDDLVKKNLYNFIHHYMLF